MTSSNDHSDNSSSQIFYLYELGKYHRWTAKSRLSIIAHAGFNIQHLRGFFGDDDDDDVELRPLRRLSTQRVVTLWGNELTRLSRKVVALILCRLHNSTWTITHSLAASVINKLFCLVGYLVLLLLLLIKLDLFLLLLL